MRRETTAYLVLLLVLTVVGGGAWLTHQPDHALLSWAEDQPVVGGWARSFRARYLPEPLPPPPEPEPSSYPSELRLPSPPEAAAARHPRPRWWSPSDLAAGPPLGSGVEPVLPLPGRRPDPEQLASALETLGSEGRPSTVGPYSLYTDVESPDLLDGLDRVAGRLERLYVERYGVTPLGEAGEAVILFAQQEVYEEYESAQRRVSGLHAGGFAGNGLVALWRGDRRPEEVAGTLVHELVHLLNRRAIGPALSPWLDEGIADDLAESRFDEEWRLHPGELGGSEVVSDSSRSFSGGRASLALLQLALEKGELQPLERLTALDWEAFVLSDLRGRNYAHASFLVRFLCSGELASGWRSFLAHIAAGGELRQEAFLGSLNRGWTELDRDFRVWLRMQRLGYPGEITRELSADP